MARTITGMLEFLGLRAGGAVLRGVLQPLLVGGERPQVLAIGGRLRQPLLHAGCEVHEEGGLNSPADGVCAGRTPADLPGELRRFAGLVRKGGLVLLVTRRFRPSRATLCAAFLHAGLREPVQRTVGLAVITAGRV